MPYQGFRRVAGQPRRTTTPVPLPLPYRGLNTRDPLEAAPPEFASVMDNFVSKDGRLEVRDGFAQHATGVSGGVVTLMRYTKPAGNLIFAASATAIYNVTGAGAVGAAVLSGLTNGNWSWLNFVDLGGPKLVMVNGEDGVRTFDGTTWATSSWNAAPPPGSATPTPNQWSVVASHQRRLWFIKKGTLEAWFGDPLSSSLNAWQFPVGALTSRGGELIAMSAWTNDAGDGIDDRLVMVTSEGEVLVFSGVDPTSGSGFGLQGVYSIGKPVGGHRCLAKVGGDLWILTTAGIVSMAAVVRGDAVASPVSGQIQPTIIAMTKGAVGDVRWGLVGLGSREWVLVNVPRSAGVDQLALTLQTAAWSRFTGIPASAWLEDGTAVYLGTPGGKVCRAFAGLHHDDGAAINARIVFGRNRMGTPLRVGWAQAQMTYIGSPTVRPRGEIVFGATLPKPFQATSPTEGTPWGSPWGSPWGNSAGQYRTTQFHLGRFGPSGAFGMAVQLKNETFAIVNIDVSIESGGTL